MSSTFNGFSEEDIKRLKSKQHAVSPDEQVRSNVKKIDRIGAKTSKAVQQFRTSIVTDELVEQALGELDVSFDKCKLSLKSPQDISNNNEHPIDHNSSTIRADNRLKEIPVTPENANASELNENAAKPNSQSKTMETKQNTSEYIETADPNCNTSGSISNDVETVDASLSAVSSAGSNYNEAGTRAHTAKLEELQVQQKLMEEQNRRRKEMLAKALADRTKQTEEEVIKLEKIKRELQVLDGQLSQDVALLRMKIDQACLTYADAEKHYLRIEKEFLQAKLNLQKEKEKKELLTEHLYALITHNETRKAQKLVTLMEQLANTGEINDVVDDKIVHGVNDGINVKSSSEVNVVDGVDERTGKMVELNDNFS